MGARDDEGVLILRPSSGARCRRCPRLAFAFTSCAHCRWRQRKQREENREHHREYNREYSRKWREKNREYHRECSREWREKNREYHREYNREWREKNREHSREYSREWREKNREYSREYNASFRGALRMLRSRSRRGVLAEHKKLHGNPGKFEITLSEEQILELYLGDCFYCGKPRGWFAKKSAYGIDRFDPDYAPGYSPENAVTACWPCNYDKNARHRDIGEAYVKIWEKNRANGYTWDSPELAQYLPKGKK